MITKLFGMRLPLAIFVLSVLVFLSVGSLMIYSTLTNNSVEDGNWLYIKTDTCELIFPKGWYLEKGGNDTIYVVNLFSEDFQTIVHLRFYDEITTREFTKNFTDISLRLDLEVQNLYNWSLSRSENATLHFINEKTELLNFVDEWAEKRNYNTCCLLIRIENAYERNNVYYNTTGLFISLIHHRKLFEIIFYGEENSWERNQDNFKRVMDSMKFLR